MKPLARLDLNLLLTLQLLLQERNLSKVGKRLNVTPSTVSKSLAKLREWFNDPLFVKTPQGFVPTPLMLSMEAELREWQQLSSRLASIHQDQLPPDSQFNLAIESPLLLLEFGRLHEQLLNRTPNAQVSFHSWDYDSINALVQGDLDIALTGRESHPRSKERIELLPDNIEYLPLFIDLPRVYLHQQHPALSKPWDLTAFLNCRHISVMWEKQARWALDEVLTDEGCMRQICVQAGNFEQALSMAADPTQQLVATAPGYSERYCQQQFPQLTSLPIPIAEHHHQRLQIPYLLLWHKRNRHNPKLRWLIETLTALYLPLETKKAPPTSSDALPLCREEELEDRF